MMRRPPAGTIATACSDRLTQRLFAVTLALASFHCANSGAAAGEPAGATSSDTAALEAGVFGISTASVALHSHTAHRARNNCPANPLRSERSRAEPTVAAEVGGR